MATLQSLGTVRLRLRLGGEDYQETLHAVQGDTGRVLEFDVLDGDGTVVTDLTGVTPVLFVRKPDGKEVGSATGEIVGGVIRITIPSSLLAYAGETKAQIQLVDSANQHKLHDHLYRLQIEESLEAGASPGENLWFSLAELTEAIEEVHLLVEQYDTDVAAVATMRDDVITKHGEVTTMHASLQDVYDTEQERRTAESARIQQWSTWEGLIEEGEIGDGPPFKVQGTAPVETNVLWINREGFAWSGNGFVIESNQAPQDTRVLWIRTSYGIENVSKETDLIELSAQSLADLREITSSTTDIESINAQLATKIHIGVNNVTSDPFSEGHSLTRLADWLIANPGR